MKLRLIRHLWGVEGNAIEQFDHWQNVGYRGIEIPITALDHAVVKEAQRRDWDIIVQIFSDGWNYSHDVDQHIASFSEQLDQAMALEPLLINCHGGEDSFSDQQCVDFFGKCLDKTKENNAEVVWETHRGRALFTPWRTRMLCETFSDLQLCADFSHWTCVCERLLHDEEATLQAILPAVKHIHARIGHSQGPQVNDPRSAQFAQELAWFSAWWQRMWCEQKAQGCTETTVCPEFGPIPYMPTLPHTGVPVANLNDICDWTAKHIADLFDE